MIAVKTKHAIGEIKGRESDYVRICSHVEETRLHYT